MPFDLSKLSQLTQNYGTGAIQDEAVSLGYMEVEIGKLSVDSQQPRKNFSEEGLKELAESIKQYGLLQPIVVRRKENSFLIVAGERRFRAAKLAGQTKVKIVILDDACREAEIGYIQMAENMKRSDLSVDEIAEFICERIELGEKQTDIADKLGLDKGLVSKYSSWREMPECLCEAAKTGKLGGIQAAYALYKTWQDYPEETEKFLASKEKISQSEAKKFDPKSCFESTCSSDSGEGAFVQAQTAETESEPMELSAEESAEVRTSADDGFNPTSRGDGANSSDSESDDDEVKDAISSSLVDSFSNKTAESESHSNDIESDELFKESQKGDFLTGLENSGPDPLEEKAEDTPNEIYKKPIIFCFVEGRGCELLYRQKTIDGIVCVKYEDGSESEVAAEKVLLNRICES